MKYSGINRDRERGPQKLFTIPCKMEKTGDTVKVVLEFGDDIYILNTTSEKVIISNPSLSSGEGRLIVTKADLDSGIVKLPSPTYPDDLLYLDLGVWGAESIIKEYSPPPTLEYYKIKSGIEEWMKKSNINNFKGDKEDGII